MIAYKEKTDLELRVNGQSRTVTVPPGELLLDTLRNRLGLTGAKPGCRNGDCGACTVLVDNSPVKSCLMLTVEVAGHDILTVEGLQSAPEQKAFIEQFAFQCGYCTSGFLMVCHALRTQHPNPPDHVIDAWLDSNICRCTSYAEIGKAVRSLLSGEIPKSDAQNKN
ncbi:MAG TPA: (2Fe-2S)-binding protein [Papillibacter sp.]|nr:(2Fe-2S)-binding protein [Papillibacter sp.]